MDPAPASSPVLALSSAGASRLKWILALLAVASLGVLAWLVWGAAKSDEQLARWDEYGTLRRGNEDEERFFRGDGPIYQLMRDRYVADLEKFLTAVEAEGRDDALAPQVRWRVVKTEGESLLSMKDVLDVAQRVPHAERAIAHLKALQDKYPDFPLNWGQSFAPKGFASQTRRLIDWFERNRDWERENLPKDAPADASVVILWRTDRGAMRMGLYAAEGPNVTARVIANAQQGLYDGTALAARYEQAIAGETSVQAVRGGDPRSLNAKPYDRQDHLRFAKDAGLEGLLQDESRNRILHVRGVVTTWHESDAYDDPQQLLFVVRDSPGLNYQHTPIGRLLDAASLATLDRVFEGKVWKDDPIVNADTGELAALKDLYKAPARIVKALVYKDGALLAGSAAPLATKAVPDESEKSLSTVKPDAYKVAPPPEPAPDVPAAGPAPGKEPGNEPGKEPVKEPAPPEGGR